MLLESIAYLKQKGFEVKGAILKEPHQRVYQVFKPRTALVVLTPQSLVLLVRKLKKIEKMNSTSRYMYRGTGLLSALSHAKS